MKKEFMEKALELAEKGRGYTYTNPLVGCVLVKNGKIIGQGYHRAFGQDHAEIDAIKRSTEAVEGADLYVNLEPCSHYGKTGPCADRIVQEKIKNVYIGCLDPNPKVAGRGVEILRGAGIHVEVGLMEEEAREINKAFFYNQEKGLPYMVFKAAMSLDGKIATRTGDSQWISSVESRAYGHRLRAELDGIMVGINTLIRDNPRLNLRHGIEGNDPARIVVDSNLRIPLDSQILNLKSQAPTIIGYTRGDKEKIKVLEDLENVILIKTAEKDGRVNLKHLIKEVYRLNIGSILLEGGGSLAYSCLEEGLINEVNFFIAPILIGGSEAKTPIDGRGFEKLIDARSLEIRESKLIGRDILIRGDLCLQE